jgi:hypothetical protein
MSTIIRMLRFGRTYRIHLDCGHVMERTQDETKLQQLYIDKQIGCAQCAAERGHEAQPPARSN